MQRELTRSSQPKGSCPAGAHAQVAPGFLLPMALHAVRESREYMAFCRRHAERPKGWAGAVYEAIWRAAGGERGMGFEHVLLAAMLLGALWLAVASAATA